MQKPFLLALVVLLCSFAPLHGQLDEMAASLDDAIHSVPLTTILPELARTLAVEEPLLREAMVERKLKLSEVCLAKFVAETKEQPLADCLKTLRPQAAGALLKEHQLSEKEAADYLDSTQTEVAFMMLDFREKRNEFVRKK